MFPVPIRYRLTAVILIVFATAAIALVANTQSTTAQPGRTIPGTIPPSSPYRLYFPMVTGSHYTVGVMPTK